MQCIYNYDECSLEFITSHYFNCIMFYYRVLGRIFGPKRYEVRGGWRKLHDEELHNLQSSPSIIAMVSSRRLAGNSKNGEEECV
jgi:hypothetical protein